MAPKVYKRPASHATIRDKPAAMFKPSAFVRAKKDEGKSEQEVRDLLVAKKLKKARVSQLMKVFHEAPTCRRPATGTSERALPVSRRPSPSLHDSRPEELGSDRGSVWEWLNTSLDKAGDPRGDSTRELTSFSQFTSAFEKEIDHAGHPFIHLPCGPCGGSERCLAQYLLHVRWYSEPGAAPRQKPLPVDDLRRRAGRIRSGAAEYNHLVALPSWLVAGNEYSTWLCKQFAAWGREDAANFAKAKHEHVVLHGSSIEEFCIALGVQILDGTHVSDRQLVCALACRFQSGTNARYYNQTDIKWNRVARGKGLGEYGCFQIGNTKRISATQKSVKVISTTRSVVSRYIDDDVTGLLFEEHCKRHMQDRSGDEYFFPAFNCEEIDWKRPLQNATLNAFIQDMVASMDIATTEKARLYTTTAIRRGNQAVTEAQVQKYRQQRNKDCGWAKDSFVPQKSYTPDVVALAPGPLFWDIQQSNEALRKASLHMRVSLMNKRACKECGMPVCSARNACTCEGCNEILANRGSGSKARISHAASCWRKGQRRHTNTLPKKVWDAWHSITTRLDDIDVRYEGGYTFVAREDSQGI